MKNAEQNEADNAKSPYYTGGAWRSVDSLRREFIKALGGLTDGGKYDIRDAFTDAVAAIAAAIEKPFSHAPDECEARYQAVVDKRTDKKAAVDTLGRLLAIVVDALERRRESFLGPVLEEIGASNVRNGQFLTPNPVAQLCSKVVTGDKVKDYEEGKLLTCYDSSVGAGVMLIHEGEALLKAGVRQRDIFLVGGDIDLRALDITFIELSLLGYAAQIEHADALAMKKLSRTRWTAGYFFHGTQWRDGSMARANNLDAVVANPPFSANGGNDAKPVQMELAI